MILSIIEVYYFSFILIADDKDFLTKKVDPNNKYFVYSQNMYKKDKQFKIDYKKKLQILNCKMEKKQVQVHMESLNDPQLIKLKSNMYEYFLICIGI